MGIMRDEILPVLRAGSMRAMSLHRLFGKGVVIEYQKWEFLRVIKAWGVREQVTGCLKGLICPESIRNFYEGNQHSMASFLSLQGFNKHIVRHIPQFNDTRIGSSRNRNRCSWHDIKRLLCRT